MTMYFAQSDYEVISAMRTARSGGAVGGSPVVVRWAAKVAQGLRDYFGGPIDALDYGCGRPWGPTGPRVFDLDDGLAELSGRRPAIATVTGIDYADSSGSQFLHYRSSRLTSAPREVSVISGPLAVPTVELAFASNVLNVQTAEDKPRARALVSRVAETLAESVVMAGGVALANMPASPRKHPLSTSEVFDAWCLGFDRGTFKHEGDLITDCYYWEAQNGSAFYAAALSWEEDNGTWTAPVGPDGEKLLAALEHVGQRVTRPALTHRIA